jgi:glycosyltransferase involved in cell wall biosynthesis
MTGPQMTVPGRPLRILYVTSVCPYGPSYGAQLRVLNIGRLLKSLGRVSLIIAAAEEIDPGWLARAETDFEHVHVARIEQQKLRGVGERIRFETDPSFLNTRFSAVNAKDRANMERLLSEYDLTWVHSIQTANEFRIFRWPRAAIDIDDIPSRFYASRAKSDSSFFRSIMNGRMSRIWRRREELLKKRFDALCVCSEDDRRYFGDSPSLHVVHNGFSPPGHASTRSPASPPRLGFIGTFRYGPNRDGVDWFVKMVWPRVKRAIPGSRLRLVGLESDSQFANLGSDIDGLGYLDDPIEEIATWSAMIVPVRIGGGTRIKIAEAFSRRCPVVATSLGAFGYEVSDGRELLIADRPRDFANACIRLMSDPALGRRLTEIAWEAYIKNWTWDANGPAVEKVVQGCLTSNSALGYK